MISIVAGSAIVENGSRKRVIRPEDGPVRLTKALEKRLVSLGVAETSEDVPGDDEDEPTDLQDMNLIHLKDIADELGIKYPSKVKKADLIKLIEAAQDEGNDGDDGDDDEPPELEPLEAE